VTQIFYTSRLNMSHNHLRIPRFSLLPNSATNAHHKGKSSQFRYDLIWKLY